MILAMLLMASCGIIEYIIKAIANWSDQVFQYEVTQELRVEEPDPELPDTQYYDSLEAALDAYGVTTEYVGIQFPEGYVFSDVYVRMHADAIKIVASYTCGEAEILLIFWHYKDSTSLEFQAAEKLPADAECYTRNGIDHYIMSNSGESTVVTWVVGSELYRISGDFSDMQALQMIESIH